MHVEPVRPAKKYTIEDSAQGARIVIFGQRGSLWRIWLHAFLFATLLAVFIPAAVQATTDPDHSPGELLIHLVGLIFVTGTLYITILYTLGISEIVEVQSTVLVIRPVLFLGHKALPAGRARAYAVEHIRNLGVFRGDLGLALSFSYGAQTVYFAPRISEQGAEEIRAAIYRRLPSVVSAQTGSSNSA